MVRDVQTLVHLIVSLSRVSNAWDALDTIDLAIVLPDRNEVNLGSAAASCCLNQVVEITRQIFLSAEGRVLQRIALMV
jgi:hypothetical protein